MTNSTDIIKERLSIVDVVGSYITLTPRGNSFVARCPFHNEKTPSFYVTPDRGTYHCFGCGKGGDIFSFVQDFEGLDFKEALSTLAIRAGVELMPYQGSANQQNLKDEKERLYKIVEDTILIYKDSLLKNTEAKKYLEERALSAQTLKTFSVGYATNEWRYLTTLLKQKGYTDEELVSVGLSVPTQKGLYDKFRGRVIFPIANIQGRFVGFSGRILPQYAQYENGNEAPKYMNSPETPLYHKGSVLYGYEIARDAIRKNSRVIVVEGMMDVLMSHQAGVYETVGVSGTALTAEHAKLLHRLAEKVYLCFDSDEAGMQALFRIIPLLLEIEIDIYVIKLPSGMKDPADVVYENDKLWIDSVNNALPLIDFLVEYAKNKNSNIKDLRNFSDTYIIPIIAKMTKVIHRAHAINVLSRSIDLPEEAIYSAIIEKSKNKNYIKESPVKNNIKQNSPPVHEIFIGLYKLDNTLKNMGYETMINDLFKKFLGSSVEDIVGDHETDGHTLESHAQKGLDDAEDKKQYIEELTLGFIKKYLEDNLKNLKNNESDLQIISDYSKKLDLINRQHHNNNYE
jgi:DNA primase